MKFYLSFGILGLLCDWQIEIKLLNNDLVAWAIRESRGSKISAIKLLRNKWPDPFGLGLKEARDMIMNAWPVGV